MARDSSAIRAIITDFILREFLPGEPSEELTESVGLFDCGVLDSINVLRMVAFLEERFNVSFAPHELGRDYMNTVGDISRLVSSKL